MKARCSSEGTPSVAPTLTHVYHPSRSHPILSHLVNIFQPSLYDLGSLQLTQDTKRPVQHATQDIAGAQPQQVAVLGVAEDRVDAGLDEEVRHGQQAVDADAVLEGAADAGGGEGRAPELVDGGEAEGARDHELHVAHLAHLLAQSALHDVGLERHRGGGVLLGRCLGEKV